MLNIDKLIATCDTIQRRTIYAQGYAHTSSRIFDSCMRLFDCECPAQAVTLRVFFNAPVMRPGTVTIGRDGSLTCQLDN